MDNTPGTHDDDNDVVGVREALTEFRHASAQLGVAIGHAIENASIEAGRELKKALDEWRSCIPDLPKQEPNDDPQPTTT